MSACSPVRNVSIHLPNESPTAWQLVKKLVAQIWEAIKGGLEKIAAYWEGSPLKNQLVQFAAFRFLSGCFGSAAEKVELAWKYTQTVWLERNQHLLHEQMARLEAQLAQAQKQNDVLLTQYKGIMQGPSMAAGENSELMSALQMQCAALQQQLRTIETWFREVREDRLRNCFRPIQNGPVIEDWQDFLTTHRQIRETFDQIYPQIRNEPGVEALRLLLQMHPNQLQIANNEVV